MSCVEESRHGTNKWDHGGLNRGTPAAVPGVGQGHDGRDVVLLEQWCTTRREPVAEIYPVAHLGNARLERLDASDRLWDGGGGAGGASRRRIGAWRHGCDNRLRSQHYVLVCALAAVGGFGFLGSSLLYGGDAGETEPHEAEKREFGDVWLAGWSDGGWMAGRKDGWKVETLGRVRLLTGLPMNVYSTVRVPTARTVA